MMGVVGLTTVQQQQQPQSHMPSQAYANYAMGPPQLRCLFQSWVYHQFLCVGVHYSVCLLLSVSNVAAIFTNGDSTIGVCTTATLHNMCMTGIPPCGCWFMAHTRGVPSSCYLHCFEWGEPHAVLWPFNQYGREYSLVGLAASHQIPSSTLHGGRSLLFQLLFHMMKQSTPNLWWVLNLVISVWWLETRLD